MEIEEKMIALRKRIEGLKKLKVELQVERKHILQERDVLAKKLEEGNVKLEDLPNTIILLEKQLAEEADSIFEQIPPELGEGYY